MWLYELLSERPDRIDCVSEAAWSSPRFRRWLAGRRGDCGRAEGGDAGIGICGETDDRFGEAEGRGEAEGDVAAGNGGALVGSAKGGRSGPWAVEGTNIVLRTSRLPLVVLDLFVGAACCTAVSIVDLRTSRRTDHSKGVSDVCHRAFRLATILFLDRSISDVHLELGRNALAEWKNVNYLGLVDDGKNLRSCVGLRLSK